MGFLKYVGALLRRGALSLEAVPILVYAQFPLPLLQNCLRFDLDEHLRRDEPFYLHHDAGGSNLSENFPVRAPDLFPIFDIGEVHACLDDVLQGSAGAFECRLDVAQYLNGLRVSIA
jgi:hypothetical protein